MLLGKWLRISRWEYWPLWLFYPPVVLYIFWKGLRHKHLAWFTATNPGMPLSGLVLESKQQILTALKPAGEVIPPFEVISKALKAEDQLSTFKQALAKQNLQYPVILKPDIGERGTRGSRHTIRRRSPGLFLSEPR